MKDSFDAILAMAEMQKAVAGPFFAELATEETWRELLRFTLREPLDRTGVKVQLLEVAALAVWALESSLATPEMGNN